MVANVLLAVGHLHWPTAKCPSFSDLENVKIVSILLAVQCWLLGLIISFLSTSFAVRKYSATWGSMNFTTKNFRCDESRLYT
jgi:hypothetical protein